MQEDAVSLRDDAIAEMMAMEDQLEDDFRNRERGSDEEMSGSEL
jgi:hypothetical protein